MTHSLLHRGRIGQEAWVMVLVTWSRGSPPFAMQVAVHSGLTLLKQRECHTQGNARDVAVCASKLRGAVEKH